MSLVDDVAKYLKEREASFTCAEMKDLMQSLGFKVADGKKGNHKTITHDFLAANDNFYGSNYDCGHGNQLNVAYPRNMRRLLAKYKESLEKFLESKQ